MRNLFLVIVSLVVLSHSSGRASALYAPVLPPGILSIEVDDHPIDSLTSPTTNSSTPEISGRVDDSLATLDLAITTDGETLRFPAAIGGAGRFRAVAPQDLPDGNYSLYANDVLVGTFTILAGTPGPRSPGALLDIARVVPYPIDAAGSMPALAFLDGRFYNLAEEAARTAARNPDGLSARELERQLAMAGWLQRYENRLAVPNSENPRAFDLLLTSFVIEYASGTDARAAFDSLNSSSPAEFPTVGDESQLVFMSGATPDTGAPYQAARLAFRVGPLLGVIVWADLLNRPPDLAILESVGTAVADRGRLVADRQVIPLGSMALRLDLDEAEAGVTPRSLYEIRAGALTAVYWEADDARERRAEMLAGTTDAFTTSTSGQFSRSATNRGPRQSTTATPGAAPVEASPSPRVSSPPAAVSFTSSLYAFPSDNEADAWMTGQENATAALSGTETTFERVSDAPALADAAAVFSMTTSRDNGPDLGGYRVLARAGAIVTIVDIQSAPGVSLRGAVSLVEEQLACIEAQGCTGSTSLPGSIFGTRERPPG